MDNTRPKKEWDFGKYDADHLPAVGDQANHIKRLRDLLADAARQLEVGGVNTKDALALIVRIEQELEQ